MRHPPSPAKALVNRIYVSHLQHDRVIATELMALAEPHGHRAVFMDYDPAAGVPQRRNWERDLAEHLQACDAVVVLCSIASMASRWIGAEIAHARALGKTVFAVQVGPCRLDPALLDHPVIDLVTDRRNAWQQLWMALRFAGLGEASLFDWEPGRAPYPGAAGFREEDVAVYFGRDVEVRAALSRIYRMQRFGAADVLVIVGPPGCGKASLLRAGLLPRLLRDSMRWIALEPFAASGDTFMAFAASIRAVFQRYGEPLDVRTLASGLRQTASTRDPQALHRLTRRMANQMSDRLRRVAGRMDATPLLMIEGFGALLDDDREHMAFLSLFAVLVQNADHPFSAVITLDTDSLVHWQRGAARAGLAYDVMCVDPLHGDALRQAIEKPAEIGGLLLETALVGRLLADVQSAGPLGQTALAGELHRMWVEHGSEGYLASVQYKGLLLAERAPDAPTVPATAPDLAHRETALAVDERALAEALARASEDTRDQSGAPPLAAQPSAGPDDDVDGETLLQVDTDELRRRLDAAPDAPAPEVEPEPETEPEPESQPEPEIEPEPETEPEPTPAPPQPLPPARDETLRGSRPDLPPLRTAPDAPPAIPAAYDSGVLELDADDELPMNDTAPHIAVPSPASTPPDGAPPPFAPPPFEPPLPALPHEDLEPASSDVPLRVAASLPEVVAMPARAGRPPTPAPVATVRLADVVQHPAVMPPRSDGRKRALGVGLGLLGLVVGVVGYMSWHASHSIRHVHQAVTSRHGEVTTRAAGAAGAATASARQKAVDSAPQQAAAATPTGLERSLTCRCGSSTASWTTLCPWICPGRWSRRCAKRAEIRNTPNTPTPATSAGPWPTIPPACSSGSSLRSSPIRTRPKQPSLEAEHAGPCRPADSHCRYRAVPTALSPVPQQPVVEFRIVVGLRPGVVPGFRVDGEGHVSTAPFEGVNHLL